MEDLSTKVTTDQLTAVEFVQPMDEIQKVITNAGISLSSGDVSQMAKALSTLVAAGNFLTATGAVTAMTLTSVGSHQPIASYVDGMKIRFRPSGFNTTTAAINVDGLGSKQILQEDGTALNAFEVTGAKDCEVRYDTASGGRFLLLRSAIIPFDRGFIQGGAVQTNVSDAQVSISPCRFRNDDNTQNGNLSTEISKDFSLVWASGDNNGGFASGATWAPSTSYGVFLLLHPDGSVDAGIDDDLAGANLVIDAGAGWTATLIQFMASDDTAGGKVTELTVARETDRDYMNVEDGITVVDSATVDETGVTVDTPAPGNTMCDFVVMVEGSTVGGEGRITEGGLTAGIFTDKFGFTFGADGEKYSTKCQCPTNAGGQIKHDVILAADGDGEITIVLLGWRFNRDSYRP